jgi:hypothetical protein
VGAFVVTNEPGLQGRLGGKSNRSQQQSHDPEQSGEAGDGAFHSVEPVIATTPAVQVVKMVSSPADEKGQW